jgi:addiction module HigA family antidote
MTRQNEYFPQSRPHPGKTLVEKLEEMGISSKEFAECTDRPEQIIIAVLNGKGVITPDLVVQFEKVTRIPAHFWLNSQRNYDEFRTRTEYKKTRETVLFES